jgi:hypothetical protein
VSRETILASAVRVGCRAADVHLTCSYPSCGCKQIPAAVIAGVDEAFRQIGTQLLDTSNGNALQSGTRA